MVVPPFIIFTKLENHFQDIMNKLKEEDDYDDMSAK
jgi:hypothetical protein